MGAGGGSPINCIDVWSRGGVDGTGANGLDGSLMGCGGVFLGVCLLRQETGSHRG